MDFLTAVFLLFCVFWVGYFCLESLSSPLSFDLWAAISHVTSRPFSLAASTTHVTTRDVISTRFTQSPRPEIRHRVSPPERHSGVYTWGGQRVSDYLQSRAPARYPWGNRTMALVVFFSVNVYMFVYFMLVYSVFRRSSF